MKKKITIKQAMQVIRQEIAKNPAYEDAWVNTLAINIQKSFRQAVNSLNINREANLAAKEFVKQFLSR